MQAEERKMETTMEPTQTNQVKLTVTVPAVRFEEALQEVYLKNRNKINVQGFRKGKAPRKLIEMQFGKEVFHEDAINNILPEAYSFALDTHNIDVVSKPVVDVNEASTETGLSISFEVYVKPEVVLADYKGITYKKADISVKEEEIDAQLQQMCEKNARVITVSDRSAQMGDIATINFEGFMNGVPFEGGKGENYELTLGSHQFIDTFEDQIVGKNINDNFDVVVTFPTNYGQEDLAGKEAVFKVTLLSLATKELPPIDDDFAQDVSEFDTLEDYRKHLREELVTKKENSAKQQEETAILDGLVARCQMDVPAPMIDNEIDNMTQDFSNRLRQQGMDLEMFLSYTGQDKNALKESYRPQATAVVKTRLALEQVTKMEDIAVSADEVNEELDKMAAIYKLDRARIETMIGERERKNIENDLKVQKALQLVVNASIAED